MRLSPQNRFTRWPKILHGLGQDQLHWCTLLNVALIGYGRWGKIYEKTLNRLEEYNLSAVVSRKSEYWTAKKPGVHFVSSFEDLLSMDVDAIIIATPPHTHPDYIRWAIRMKMACLVEKPVCLSSKECLSLHEEIQKAEIPLLVGYLQLFSPRYQQLKNILEESGEPVKLLISEGMGLGPFRSETPALWDWLPHDVSMCLDIFGTAEEPSVESLTVSAPSSDRPGPEMVYARLQYEDGRTAIINAGGLYPARQRKLSVFTDNSVFHLSEIHDPSLTVTDFKLQKLGTYGSTWYPSGITLKTESQQLPLDSMLGYFAGALRNHDSRYMGLGFSIEVSRLIERIIEQAR
ncbi:MAG: Gfo/Idh/MocA family oxidoreductase [Bacteroidota bacterium]|nr:Gfo/Idh/MocA family oxidoreductase [Bacteroidota bacterium]